MANQLKAKSPLRDSKKIAITLNCLERRRNCAASSISLRGAHVISSGRKKNKEITVSVINYDTKTVSLARAHRAYTHKCSFELFLYAASLKEGLRLVWNSAGKTNGEPSDSVPRLKGCRAAVTGALQTQTKEWKRKS